MNTKVKILIVAVLIVVVVALVVNQNVKKKVDSTNTTNTTQKEKPYTKLDNETGMYIVYNEKGEEITRVQDEASAQIYIDNPDYDPKLPGGSYTEPMENEVY